MTIRLSQPRSPRLQQRLTMTTGLASVLSTFLMSSAAHALPASGIVSGGQAIIWQSGTQTTVNQSTSRAVIDWGSFNVGSGESVQFNQPSSAAIALSRIHDASPSRIDGTLTANGQVWLVNPNGMLFGQHAQVNVGGLLATSSDIDNASFMAGGSDFTHPGNPNAVISNAGRITIADGGIAALVGPNVTNDGLIEARLGRVALGSGDTFTLDLYGDGLINLKASPAITRQIVSNNGILAADGGQVLMTAAAAGSVVNSLINMDGIVQANSVGGQNGIITLYAEGSNAVAGNVAADKGQKTGTSTVLVSGTLSASGYGPGQTGGTIQVLGDNVGILSGSVLDASGDAGGGTIRIGGDFHGAGTIPTALNTYVDANSLILANAVTAGNGGNVAVWSDGTTQFYGNIVAEGGTSSGNGGLVETSGHAYLDAEGYVDLTAPNGGKGTYLLDPATIEIFGGVTPAFNATDGSISLSSSLKLWLDASDTANVTLTYNATGTTASGTSGTNTITVGSNSGLVVGERIQLGGSTHSYAASVNDNASSSGVYTIAAISGTTVTLDANLASTYSGTTLYGGFVSQLTDKSGQGNNAIQATAANMPLWISNGQNGLGTLQFYQANTQSLRVNASVGGVSAATALISYSPNDTVFNLLDTSGDDSYFAFGGGAYLGTFRTTRLSAYPAVMPTSGSHIVAITSDNTSYQAFLDSNGKGAQSANYNAGTFLNIGIGNVAGAYNGTISDIMTYGVTLSTNARNLVEQYQSAKWNIALTPPGTGATEAQQATASNGYSVFADTYLQRLSQSANIVLSATGNVTVDLQGDNLALASGKSLSITAGSNGTGSIVANSAGTITTSGGNITLASGTTSGNIQFNNAFTLASGGGNITLSGPVSLGANLTVSSGGGAVTFGGTVDGSNSLTVNAGAGSATFTGAVGGSTPLGTLAVTGPTTLDGNVTTASQNITFNSAVTLGANDTLNTGGGSSAITFASTVDSSGGARNLTLTSGSGGITMSGAMGGSSALGTFTATSAGSMSFAAFTGGTVSATTNATGADITLGGNLTSTGNVFADAYRNLTINSGVTIETGTTGFLRFWSGAANINNTGIITMNGTLEVGSGDLSLFSGVDGSGNRADLTLTPSTLIYRNTNTNGISFDEFRDITISADLLSSSNVSLNAARNLTVGNITTGATGVLVINAAGQNTSATGIFTLNGTLTVGTGYFQIYSGKDGLGNRANITLNNSNLILEGATVSQFWLEGFNNMTLQHDISTTIAAAFHFAADTSLTLAGNLTIGLSGQTFSSTADGVPPITLIGNSSITTNNGAITLGTVNGAYNLALNSGTAATTLSTVGGTTPLGNLTITTDSLTLGNKVYGTGTLTLQPYTAGTAMHVTDGTSSGWYLNGTELGYIQPDWTGVVLGNTGDSGAMTVGATTWANPVSFVTGSSGGISVTGTQTGTGSASMVFTGPTTLSGNLTTANQNITLNSAVTLGATDTINAGSGTVTFGSTVNGGYNLTANAGTLSLAGAWGGTTPLSAVSLVSASSLTLPAITASSLLAETTGVSADLTISGQLTASGTGTPVTLAAGRNFINGVGSGVLSLSGAGSPRWLIYSTNPASNTLGGLSESFHRYSCTYGGSCPALGSGNGLLYSLSPTITVTANGESGTYGSLAAFTAGYSGFINGDTAATALSGSPSLTTNASLSTSGNANVGTWTITAAAGTLASGMGYQLSYAGGSLAVAAKAVSVTGVSGTNKVYDAGTADAITGTASLSGLVGSDAVTLNAAGATASFATANVGNGKAVTFSGYSISGTDAGDYSFSQPASSTANITPASLTVTAKNVNMIYADGTTLNGTTGFTTAGLLGSDTVSSVSLASNATLSGSGNWNAGTWAITPSAALGSGLGNYAIAYASGTQSIAAKAVSITGVAATGKVYDATAADSLNTAGETISGKVAGDGLAIANGSGSFADANVGTNKPVTATGFTLTGSDAADYSLDGQPASLTASITPAALTVTTKNVNMTYSDGTVLSPTAGFTTAGLLGSDAVSSVSLASNATFSGSGNWNVGTWVITPSAALGSGLGNYTIAYAAGTQTIAAKAVTITGVAATDKIYDTTAADTLNTAGEAISGKVPGDGLAIANGTGSFADANVGTNKSVTAAAFSLSGADVADYSLAGQPASLTASITQAALTVTAENEAKSYGTTDPAFTFTYTGLVTGDTHAAFTGALGRTVGENPGRYAISQGSLAATGNYAIGTFIPGLLTIDAGAVAQAAMPAIAVPEQVVRIIATTFAPPVATWGDPMNVVIPAPVNNAASTYIDLTGMQLLAAPVLIDNPVFPVMHESFWSDDIK
jgi:trimeric autotransporter adhesin